MAIDTGAAVDPQDAQDIESDLFRIDALLSTGIFRPECSGHPLLASAFTELVIVLRDLLHKCERYARRIDFTDDVIQNDYVRDVTDAVTAARDACCHVDSFKRTFDDRGNRGSFIVMYGKGTAVAIGDLNLGSDYEDDTAVWFGTNRLYLGRHVIRAVEEAATLLKPLIAR